MDFCILGPLEVLDGGRPLALGGRKQRALLALLLLHAGEAVSTDRLVDELWGERPPATAAKLVQGYVAALRKLLPDGVLVTRAPGYLLGLDAASHSLDLRRFEALVTEANDAAPERAVGLFREALALWRGPALGDVSFGGLAASEVAGLNDSRLVVLTHRIELELGLGRHADLVGELESLVAEHPFQERLRAQLILALYRSGRQAEALEAYRDARRALDELGIEPSAELGRLEKAILTQDEGLEPPRRPREFQPERRDDVYAVMSPPRVEAKVIVADAPSKLPTSSHPSWEQRKTVTVLFCDVTGSTALAESVDPEVLRALLARYFERMQAIVARHGGVVEKFIGDAVMAVFGVPVVHEDDALRAVRAAVEMRDALPELGVRARIGVNTGEVVTGTTERLATGDAVNVAKRLEETATPGDVLMGEHTLALVRDSVDVGPAEPLALKGKTERLAAYRLLSVHELREHREGAPMVGREGELERMRAAFEQVVADRSCQLFTVVGEAGLGKSRLVREFLARLEGTVAIGRCLPYGEGITYWPVVEVVNELGSLPSDPAAAAAIRSLLGRSEAGTSAEEIAWAFRKLLEQIAQEEPLVVVFDDVQWGEETFLDLVEHVALLSTGAPILLLCMARLELLDRRPTWPVVLTLEPLADEHVRELMVGTEPKMRTKVTRRAGGNPLFVAEMLAIADTAEGDLAVPPTLQALLAARLDQLDPAQRRVIEAGAIEGEIFHRGTIAALVRGEPQVTPHLASLVRKRLIRPVTAQLPGDDGFRFRHLLLRDAAYESLTKARRADLHQRFADCLEQRSNVLELAEILGHHLEQAARYRAELAQPDVALTLRAGERLAAAGRRALDRGDHRAAASLLQRAADLTRPLRLDIHLELDLAAAQAASGIQGSASILEAAAKRAQIEGDETAAALAGTAAAAHRAQFAADVSLVDLEALGQRSVRLLEQADDHHGLVHAWLALSQVASLRGRYDEQASAAEQAIRHGRVAGRRSVGLFGLPMALIWGPRPADEALRTLEAVSPENPPPLQLLFRACLLAMLGRIDEASSLARSAEEKLREQTGDYGGEDILATIATLDGDYETGVQYLRGYCDTLEAHGFRSTLSTTAPRLGRWLCKLGHYAKAEPLAQLGRELGNEDDVETQALWREVQALVDAHQGAHTTAETMACEALAITTRTDALNMQGDALCDLAEVLATAGRDHEAAAALERGLDRYQRKRNLAMVAQVGPRLDALRAKVQAHA